VGGDHDDRRGLAAGRQLHGGVETGFLAQADIDQHDIGAQRLDALDRLGAGAGDPGHRHAV
jgi:hypothetical protein